MAIYETRKRIKWSGGDAELLSPCLNITNQLNNGGMRDIKMLLRLTRRKLIPYMLFEECNGICGVIATMASRGHISFEEMFTLDSYTAEHRPQYAECGSYWWHPGVIRPRYAFLSKLIKEL
jgi:hypothetical protein